MAQQQSGHKIWYGVDAPGVIRTLLGLGIFGSLIGSAALLGMTMVPIRILGAIILAGSLVPFVLGLSMVVYVNRGKHRLRDWMLSRHSWSGNEAVLDIGAGRGLMAIGAAKKLSGGKVLAIDIWSNVDLSSNSIEALRRNTELAGVADKVEIRSTDARKLDLSDNSIDVVLSVLCLHNIEPEEDRMAACREIARVLKPGGLALIADYTATPSYAKEFRAAGLSVQGPENAFHIALSMMMLVRATKPRI